MGVEALPPRGSVTKLYEDILSWGISKSFAIIVWWCHCKKELHVTPWGQRLSCRSRSLPKGNCIY
ncbi:hypothetical protein BABINDRAFT_159046, partial [Babjeviella inositovora NRRL Y-12698]